MSSTDQNTPADEIRPSQPQGGPRNPKPETPPSPRADQLQAAEAPIDTAAAPADLEL